MTATSVDREPFRWLVLHRQLLNKRLYLHACVRYLVAAAIAFGAWFARDVVGIEGLSVGGLWTLAGVLLVYNTIVFLIVRDCDAPDGTGLGYPVLVGITHSTIALDFLVLTFALWMVGGAVSPFQAWYVLHVIVASVLLSRRAAFGYALLGYALFAGLVLGEWIGWIPFVRPAGAVLGTGPLDARQVVTLLVVQGLLFTLTAYLLTSLAQALRSGDRELRETNRELARLSAMRRDFLHVATHDLKSPVAAALAHLHNLQAGLGGGLSEQQEHWVERCRVRLHEVLDFLRDLQLLAGLEGVEFDRHAQTVDIGALLRKIVAKNQDLAQMRGHSLVVDVPEALPVVHGIDRLLQEAVENLVTNAIKYTPEHGRIVVRAAPRPEGVRIEIEDNGIGIAPEDQARLFREFVRIRAIKAPQSESTGTGLGLSIVKRIAESHGGRVGVSSTPGEGSTFFIDLPLAAPRPPGETLPPTPASSQPARPTR